MGRNSWRDEIQITQVLKAIHAGGKHTPQHSCSSTRAFSPGKIKIVTIPSNMPGPPTLYSFIGPDISKPTELPPISQSVEVLAILQGCLKCAPPHPTQHPHQPSGKWSSLPAVPSTWVLQSTYRQCRPLQSAGRVAAHGRSTAGSPGGRKWEHEFDFYELIQEFGVRKAAKNLCPFCYTWKSCVLMVCIVFTRNIGAGDHDFSYA